MKESHFGFSDYLLLALGSALAIAGFIWMQTPNEILLLDRPRDGRHAPDMVEEFLKVTHTPFELKQGFVSLQATPEVEQRLLQLLGALAYCRETIEAEQQTGSNSSHRTTNGTTLAFRVTRSGSVETASPASGDKKKTGEQALPITASAEQFQRQYATVFKALAVIHRGAVADFPTDAKVHRGAVDPSEWSRAAQRVTSNVVANSPSTAVAGSPPREGQDKQEHRSNFGMRPSERRRTLASEGDSLDVRELEEIRVPSSPSQAPLSVPMQPAGVPDRVPRSRWDRPHSN